LALQIITRDKRGFVYHNGILKKDKHRYIIVYELNQKDNVLIQKSLRDLTSQYAHKDEATYYVLKKPELDWPYEQDQMKAIRYNPLTGTFTTIVFSKGKYIYTDVKDDYLNIFEGNYEINS